MGSRELGSGGLGSGGVGEVGGLGSGKLSSSREIVLASNRLCVKSSCTLGHSGQMSTLGKWDVFGTNGRVGDWDK